MKIAIDIRRMTEFGVGTYIRNVVRALGRLDHENEYFLIGSPAKVEEIGALPPNFHTVPLLASDRSIKGYFEFRSILETTALRPGAYPQSFFAAAYPALPLRDDGA